MPAKNEVPAKKDKPVKQEYPKSEFKMDKVLVENFVSLQKVMTNLAVKFENLSSNISKLLELFEISAKTLAEKDYSKKEDSKKVVEKLDSLLDQNKVIARGLALLHERANAEQPQEVLIPSQPIIPTRPMPQNFPQQIQPRPQPQQPSRVIETDRYQKFPAEQKTREMGV